MKKEPPKRVRTGHRRPRPKAQSGKTAAIWAGSLAVLIVVSVFVVPLVLMARGRPQSVLLVTMDATRLDALGCFSGTRAPTPNLDRLAAAGVRFDNCSTVSPMTLPSHCSLMTSTWPLAHGVRRDHGTRLIGDNETLAEMLGRAGLETAAVTGSASLPEVSGLNQGFASYSGVEVADGQQASVDGTGRTAREVTDRAIEALRSFGEKRFFLWVNYDDADLSAGAAAPSAQAYAGRITAMDAEIGRLVQTLDEGKRAKRALIVVVGTQGEALGEHGEFGHGSFLYETTLRVPMILRCPAALPKNRLVEAPVRTVDVVPTILDYLGRPAAVAAQGSTLRNLIRFPDAKGDRTSFAETDQPADLFGLSSLRSLTAKGWKYIDSPSPELYNLNADPDEKANLAEQKPDVVVSMRKQLSEAMVAATQTQAGGDRRITPSAQDLELLRSIGYVGATGPAGGTEAPPPDPGRAPRAHAAAIARYADARRLFADGDRVGAEAALRAVLADLPEAPEARRNLEALLSPAAGR